MSDEKRVDENALDGDALRAQIDDKLYKAVAAEPVTANHKELYKALSLVARDELAQRWVKTQIDDRRKKARRVYYMSMEFLVGRALNNTLSALNLRDAAQAAFAAPRGPRPMNPASPAHRPRASRPPPPRRPQGRRASSPRGCR